MTNRTLRGSLAPILAAALLALTACDDPTLVEDHLDVEGFALIENDTEIYRHMRDDGDAPTLSLARGLHEVVFILLDHDGEPIPEDEEAHEDGEHELQITITDASVLTWTPEDHEDGEVHETLEFHGELNALQEGGTTMTVCVPHGLHCDLEADVPVIVTP